MVKRSPCDAQAQHGVEMLPIAGSSRANARACVEAHAFTTRARHSSRFRHPSVSRVQTLGRSRRKFVTDITRLWTGDNGRNRARLRSC